MEWADHCAQHASRHRAAPDLLSMSRGDLEHYFQSRGYSEERILDHPTLYMSDAFVRIVREYSGYGPYLKKLRRHIKKQGRFGDWLKGDYVPGLKKRIKKLYARYKHEESNKVHRKQNEENQRAQRTRERQQHEYESSGGYEYHLSNNAYKYLQHHGHEPELFMRCNGNDAQQILHQETITIVEEAVSLHYASPIYDHQEALIDWAAAACEYNHAGLTNDATSIIDLCKTLLDYGKAIVEGACDGAVGAVRDCIDHPIETAACAVAGGYVLAYQLSKVVCDVAKIGIIYLDDAQQGRDEWHDYIAPITQTIEAIKNNEITLREAVKGTTHFIASWKAQGKLLGGLNKFFGTIKAKAIAFAHKNPWATPAEYMATPEGVLFKNVNDPWSQQSGIKNSSHTQASNTNIIPEFIKSKRVPLDHETILHSPFFEKTKLPRIKGATIYKKANRFYHRDTFHTGQAAHLEVYDMRGSHLGEANPLTGELYSGTADPNKRLRL